MPYKTLKKVFLDELKIELTLLEHQSSGAQVLHLGNDDTENLFNLSFQTVPKTSNGVAHILEHTVLCGSKNYPVRDPFFGMTRRSLNTFMNALTGADFTCYPAASEVPEDFYNLLSVYLDAVFHPLLTKESFLQEGHRLEFEEETNPTSPLQYKGIVFNEMKGALASGEARMSEALMEGLYPDITYGINSGGEPSEIPKLSYEELIDFHKTYYHPSRCLFFFYGNLPLQKHLDFLEEKILGQTQKAPPLPSIPKQPRFTTPKVIEKSYPLDEDPKEKLLLGFGWLTCSILDQLELLSLVILDMILMGTDAGLLKQPLLATGLCKSVESAIDGEMSEAPYLIVCKGCRDDAPDGIANVMKRTLKQIANNPIPEELIEGAVHQIEIGRTEITGNSTPYGLSLFFRSGLLKQHGGDPEDGLRIHTLFNQLREQISSPNFFSNLIHKHFLDNPHQIKVVMKPDATLSQKENEEEQKILQKLQAKLTHDEKQTIITKAGTLAALQAEEDAYDVLPKVSLKDIPKQGKEYTLRSERFETSDLHHFPCFTNGHFYVDLIYDLPCIPEEEMALFRLYIWLAPQLGCGGRSYAENLDYILQHIGGSGITLDLNPQADNPHLLKPTLSIRGKALISKREKLCRLLYDMLTTIDITDISRIRELLRQHLYEMQLSIQTSSLRYAVQLAASSYTPGGWLSERWYGLHYYKELQKLVGEFEKSPNTLIEKLEKMKLLCELGRPRDLVLTADEEALDMLKREQFYGLFGLKEKKNTLWETKSALDRVMSHARLISSPVAFTAYVFPSLPYTHLDSPAISVASELMENKFLHTAIREKGGAYGAGATNSPLSGLFYTYAFRDPNLVTSYKAFQEAINEIAAGKFNDLDLEEAKLGLFQSIDAPIAPGSRGITTFARLQTGRTLKVRQSFRERLINLTKEDIKNATNQHLAAHIEKGLLISFANKEFFEKENPLFKPTPLPIEAI